MLSHQFGRVVIGCFELNFKQSLFICWLLKSIAEAKRIIYIYCMKGNFDVFVVDMVWCCKKRGIC